MLKKKGAGIFILVFSTLWNFFFQKFDFFLNSLPTLLPSYSVYNYIGVVDMCIISIHGRGFSINLKREKVLGIISYVYWLSVCPF